jgi:tripartite ATP-independent transporter DctM subunit
MTPELMGLVIFLIVLLLMLAGVPVAIGFLAANMIGAWFLMGGVNGLIQLIDNSTNLITTFTLVAIPMFVWMGALLFHAGLAGRVFDALDLLFGRLPGRLAYVTVVGGTTFSALTGSTMANTAMLGSLMVPEMRRRGYKVALAVGPIIGTGGLAMIIPPSNLAVLTGSLARIDIGALLLAGLIPGLILAVLYCAIIAIQVARDPHAAPAYDLDLPPFSQRLRAFAVNVLPLGLVIFCVVGFIVLGIATPSEAAAFGVLASVLLAWMFGGLTKDNVSKSLETTVSVTGMVFLLIFGSAAFSQLLAFSGASQGVVAAATAWDAPVYAKLALMFLVLVTLGMFMDQISILLLTIPFFFPLASALGLDPVWFGIVVLLAMEMSLTTPPFGLLLFLMTGVAPPNPDGTRISFQQVVSAALPYLGCDLIMLLFLVAFPALALWLPGLVG